MQASLAGFAICAGLLLIGYLHAMLIVALMRSFAFGSMALTTLTTLGGSSPLPSTFFAFILLMFVFARRTTLSELAVVFALPGTLVKAAFVMELFRDVGRPRCSQIPPEMRALTMARAPALWPCLSVHRSGHFRGSRLRFFVALATFSCAERNAKDQQEAWRTGVNPYLARRIVPMESRARMQFIETQPNGRWPFDANRPAIALLLLCVLFVRGSHALCPPSP
jgi:hypothetical protein